MRETIKLAQKQGIAGIVIIGEPYYYPRFGFERASNIKLQMPGENHLMK